MKGRTHWIRYVPYGLAWTLGVTAAGALVGAVAVPLAGVLIGSEKTVAEMALAGARNLGFLSFVWAPGLGIVMAFHRAFRDRQRQDAPSRRS
ncbi:MAG: hypothetical protein D6781_00585 [Verrucomicrobia bacterium]|nr:MAG: hypothetical protein D6781_00585 [Verrucomicrobiota bacterium]